MMSNTKPQDERWNLVAKTYDLKEVLGQGSYGTVMKAVCKKTKETVAIKLITKINLTSYSARKALREI